MTKFIFDISTSARWSGHPVGIVRVERELARRARSHIGQDLAFSVYDLKSGSFRIVHDRYVEPILNGKISIEFGALDVPPARSRMRRKLRNLALKSPHAYQLIQRWRGVRFTIHEIRTLRQQLQAAEAKSAQSADPLLTLTQATSGLAVLDADTVVISGGLDWEHKNLRAIYHLKKRHGFRYVGIVYDLIPIELPHYVVPFYVTLLAEYFGELQWVADGCMCISESTRLDLLRFLGDNGIEHRPAMAFPLGSDIGKISDTDEVPAKLRDKRFVLYVSTIEPRKNHRAAYEAWCHGLLSGTIDPTRDRLVFVGRQGWNVGDLMHEIKTNPITQDTIVILENVSDGLLRTLYQQSAFVIFPSFYEGFGLPLAESFANGKICVTSGAGALREIGASFRIDVDPRDILKWSATMSDLLNAPDRIRELEAEISRGYRIVSWDQSAGIFFDGLKTMVSPA